MNTIAPFDPDPQTVEKRWASESAEGQVTQLEVSGLALRTDGSRPVVHIELRGELDHHNSRYLELVGLDALERDGVKILVLDCAGVTFVGSDGLSALIELSRAADARSARLQIANPSSVVMRLLDLAGLHRLLATP